MTMRYGAGPSGAGQFGTPTGPVVAPPGHPGASPGAPPSTVATDAARVSVAAAPPGSVPMPGLGGPMSHESMPGAVVDSAQSAQGSIQMGTDGGFAAAQYTPTDLGEAMRSNESPVAVFIAGAVLMAGVVLGGLWLLVPEPEPEVAAPVTEAPAAEPPPPVPALDPALRALALVNERDPARAQPYAQRHELLAQLDQGPDASRVDRKLNLALDLLQAADGDDPCATYAAALEAIEAQPDPYYRHALAAARAPDPSCVALDERRESLIAAVDPEAVVAEAPSPTPRPSKTRRSGKGKGSKGKRSSESSSSKPSSKPKPSSEPAVGGKLDDGLRPFGK